MVIGKRAKHLTPATALSCVLGHTIGNDVSERSRQAGDRTLWRAKNTNTFKPMGPWIETDFDLASAESVVRAPAPGHKIYPYLPRKLVVDRPNQVSPVLLLRRSARCI